LWGYMPSYKFCSNWFYY